MKKCAILILLIIASLIFAQDCVLPIGTNLAGPSDYGGEWPFVDVMKYSRKWITFNSTWVGGGQNPWDTQFLDKIPSDENGYPLELPYHVDGAETTQVVRTVWANTSTMKEGRYIVLYDGEGRLAFDFDMKLVSSSPGRCEVDLAYSGNIAALLIMESVKGNHVRNIRVLMPGTEETNAENPWCDEWMEKLEPFSSLRFMDWGHTNNSPLTTWDERPHVDDYTYTQHGIPYEWWVEISNRRMSDVWLCVPHLADEDYIRQMARLFRDDLDPSLKIYVEYSNEIWNWMFEQTHHCFNQGDQRVEWPERIAPFIQNALDIWTQEFEGQTDRLVRVVGVQHSWQDVSNRIVSQMRPESFDAFCPAAYFGFTDAGYDSLEALGSNATADHVIRFARESMLNESYEWTKLQFEQIALKYDIPMIYYEGGQHLTPRPFGSEQSYNQALMDAQNHLGMYDLYNEWFDSLRAFTLEGRPSLLMNFSFIGSKNGRYGSWGVLESQFFRFPPYKDSAPKYQALIDNMCTVSKVESGNYKIPNEFVLKQNYPNPFNLVTTIEFAVNKTGYVKLDIFDRTGRNVKILANSVYQAGEYSIDFNASQLATGVYFYKIELEGFSDMKKMVLIK